MSWASVPPPALPWAIDLCLDEIGREDGERDRHVLPHAAALTSGDAFGIRSGVAGWMSRPEPDRFWLRFGYLERVL
jgi:hypothetical protein